MDKRSLHTLELWPTKAYGIIQSKNLSVRKLKKLFNIIFPWDDNYDQQRMLFSTQIQERPLFIIQPDDEDEIIHVLNLIKRYNLTIRIVGGRHSTALQNPDVFLDMSNFNKIEFKKYIKVGAGCTQGDVNYFLFNKHKKYYFQGAKPNHPNSLTFPGGSASTVGVAGISTVGGVGVLRRTLGLTIDSIKAYRIVLPPTNKKEAEVVLASESNNSDLFWALRGGGGANFGVITKIYYQPIKIDRVILYHVEWDYKNAEDVLDYWQVMAPNRSKYFNEDLSIYTTTNNAGEKIKVIELVGVYVVPDNESTTDAINTIKSQVSALYGTLTLADPEEYAKIYDMFVRKRIYHSFSVGKTFFTKNCISGRKILDQLEKATEINGSAYIGLQLMGGEISTKSSNQTAFYPRDAKFFIDIFNYWDSVVDQEANMKWNGKTFNILYPENGGNVYLGFPIPNMSNHLEVYYGTNYKKLLNIKKRIDPLNLLKYPGSL